MALMVSKRTYQKISPTYIHTICTIILALALKNVQVKKYLQLKLVAAKNNKNVENVSEIHLTTATLWYWQGFSVSEIFQKALGHCD